MSDSETYHADSEGERVPSLSASIAKILIERTPLHAWHAHPRLNPDYQRTEKTEFDYGTAAHAMLLEGSEAALVIVEADDWRTKVAQEQKKAAYADGKTPLLARQVKRVREMAASAKAHVAASELAGIFEAGCAEQSIRWQEGVTECRMKPDWLTADKKIILDYKTTTNAHPEACLRSIVGMGYDVQDAFYRRGLRATTGFPAAFVFLFQEKDPPYACSLLALDPAMREMADQKVQWALTLWSNCMETGKWNGYGNRIAYLEPPVWYAARAEEWLDESLAEGVPL